jgi:hypothetical protein
MRGCKWVVIGTALLTAAGPAGAWGPTVHQAVTLRAIDTLPKALKPFYRDHRLEMPSLAPDAAPPEEGQERRFAVDRFLPFPFTDLPHKESEMKDRFGENAAAAGRLPWLIHQSYERLVEAFKSKDKARILAESDTLAGLVADLHHPLALTDNADGQKTAQHGLWVRFTLKFPDSLPKGLGLDPDAAHLLDDPKGYVFSMINGTYVWLDNLLYQEELAKRGQSGYGEIYYEAMGQRAGSLLRARLSQATGDVGSYWYTAWSAAGRPALP